MQKSGTHGALHSHGIDLEKCPDSFRPGGTAGFVPGI